MTRYQQGNYWERRAMAELTEHGWYVWQSRGSRSPADLIGIRHGRAVCVQVKGGQPTNGHHVTHREWNALLMLAGAAGADAILAERAARGRIRWARIIGEHVRSARLWPCEPWRPDQ